MSAGPIADLTYRGYDGPFATGGTQWWVIARAMMRLALKKRAIYFWAALSAAYYAILIIIFYFTDLTASSSGMSDPLLARLVWKDQYLNAFDTGQLFYFLIAMLIGIGTISEDNRSKALQMYLARPCTKRDYLLGKWLAIAIPMYCIAAVPAIAFYAYTAMAYRTFGSVSQDPWLLPQILAFSLLPAVLHASLCLGISSLFDQTRLAGATYAALYFMSLFFTIFIAVPALETPDSGVLRFLYYCSIDGVSFGLAKCILVTNGSSILPGANVIPRAGAGELFALFALLVVGALGVAWRKLRAVEVIR